VRELEKGGEFQTEGGPAAKWVVAQAKSEETVMLMDTGGKLRKAREGGISARRLPLRESDSLLKLTGIREKRRDIKVRGVQTRKTVDGLTRNRQQGYGKKL